MSNYSNYAVTLCLLLSACETKPPAGPPDAAAVVAPPAGPIVIGEVGALTGQEASFGISTRDGIALAVAELNAGGGVLGRKLEVRIVDDRGNAAEAEAAITRLVTTDKVVLVLGEGVSSRSLAMAPVAEARRVPMVSPASTSPKLTEGRQFVFRVCFIDAFQGFVMAKFARENLKLVKVAVLKDVRNDYSVGLAQAFVTRFKGLGGKVVADEGYSADDDFAAQLGRIKAAQPEALYLPGYFVDVGRVAKDARAMGIQVPLLGGDGWTSERLYEIAGDSIEGAYYSNHYSTQDPSPQVQKFVAEYKKAFGVDPDSFAALGYDAMKVAADSIARARSLSGPDLRDALAQTRDFPGVTGAITIDGMHNASKPAVVLKIEKGRSLYQTTVAPETKPAP